VTQMQFVATCEKISEAYLLPVIGQLLAGFPFVILGFHSDNVLNAIGGCSDRQSQPMAAFSSQKIQRHTTQYPAVSSTKYVGHDSP